MPLVIITCTAFDYYQAITMLSATSTASSSAFGKRTRPRRLLSKYRPPPSKSCLAASISGRDPTPPGEPCVRKTVHFPDDKPSLERVRIIPARPERNLQASFKKGQVAETKSFIMYTSNPSGSNQRFLSKLPGSSGPRYETHSQWMSVVRARQLAAAYSCEPRSPPRSAPSSEGSAPEPATYGSPEESSSFDMSSLKDALPEPASSGSQHGSDFDMSAMARDLPDPDKAFNMSSLADALPDPTDTFDMSSLMRSLPDLDAAPEVPSPPPVHQAVVASPPCEPRNSPPRVPQRVVQIHVQVGPFSPDLFFNLCAVFLVVGSCFPCLAPAVYAVLVLLLIHGMFFF
ncbi:hypothetical protein E8E15_010669 [Penicillium rubens]|uniref:Uncharacterized protein n=2 Tax=Penicillium chrysogenum species complex TaxID=254878 RepID=B6HMS4_PENRW|nr:hypothetical protein E8E15_010669 [Penicillium rubens]CAP95803.1 hypothetical protein PCH_Pc21g09060 [Penicillium rubens Wisconsin 54-1255]